MEWAGLGQPEIEQLRLAAYAGDVGALEWIAKDMGFYEKVGLDVDIQGLASGKAAMELLDAGKTDVVTASDFVLATRSFKDPNIRVLANISYYRNKGIVARRDRGIAEPADLRGKRIGLTSPSGAEYTLYVFLALNGLTERDVTIVSLSPEEIIRAMEQGTIDAAITWQPHVQTLQTMLGNDGITFEGSVFDVYLLLAAQQERLLVKEKAIKKLLHALVMAEDWARANPAAAKALIVKRFGLEPAALDSQWQRMRLAVTLPQELLVAMDGEARWLNAREGQASTRIPNYSTFVAAEPLMTVNPAAVTLFTTSGSTSRDGWFRRLAAR